MDLQSYAHSRGQSAYHVVLVPKYRRKAFAREDIRGCLERYLVALCRQQGWQLYALEVMPDHVHMFLEFPPSVSLSKAFQLLKGKTTSCSACSPSCGTCSPAVSGATGSSSAAWVPSPLP